jgi:hypothetical protein
VLILCHHRFGIKSESFVVDFEPYSPAQRRYSRKWLVRVGELGVDIVQL